VELALVHYVEVGPHEHQREEEGVLLEQGLCLFLVENQGFAVAKALLELEEHALGEVGSEGELEEVDNGPLVAFPELADQACLVALYLEAPFVHLVED